TALLRVKVRLQTAPTDFTMFLTNTYLIEKRSLVTQELSRVHAFGSQSDSSGQEAAALRQLVTASQILNKSAKTHLLEALA
ncbi:MAG TPA: hypothetical protein PL105_04805, partial [Caldilineaceae bacterium]|nr:hypothetical protein [Caldilineaceae bacterium]